MKNTWYLGILVFALAFVGMSIDKSASANQEIVLKFTEFEVSELETQEILHFVKSRLQELAIGEIQIHQSQKGTLKITYYSDVEVAVIKELLSNKNSFALEGGVSDSEKRNPLPEDLDLASYQLDVFEIQVSKDIAGASGTVVEFKTENIRFFTPDVYGFSEHLIKEKELSTQRAYHTFNVIALAIGDNFCTVPQVRAGPVLG